MDKVILDGVEYVKAAVAAKEFRYTTDYVGQLCRGKKVDARLVGRTWYVRLSSIKDYRQKRHQGKKKSALDAVTEQTVARSQLPVTIAPEESPAPVESFMEKLSKHAVHPVQTAQALRTQAQYQNGKEVRSLRVRYEHDDGSLLPNLHRKHLPPPASLRVTPAEAKSVRVRGAREPIAFQTTAIPEVALSGKLAVTAIAEAEEKEAVEQPEPKREKLDLGNKIKLISDNNAQHPKAPAKVLKVKRRPVSAVVSAEQSVAKVTPSHTKATPVSDTEHQVAPQAAQPALQTDTKKQPQAVVAAVPASFTPLAVQQSGRMNPFLRLSPLLATAMAVLVVGLLLSSSGQLTVSDVGYESRVVVQVANLIDFLHQ